VNRDGGSIPSRQRMETTMPAIRLRHCVVFLLPLLFGCGSKSSTAPTAFPNQGLLAFLPFDTDASDQSGNGNDGTLIGGATASGMLVLGDNTSDMLELPASVMDGLTDFTVAAWIRMDAVRGNSHELISAANAGEDNALCFWYRDHTDEWLVGVNNGSALLTTDGNIEDGEWHHMALTRSGDSLRLYLEGSASGSAVTQQPDPLAVDPGGLIFGQDQDSVGGDFEADEVWAGAVDNLRIYDRALSAGEIRLLSQESR